MLNEVRISKVLFIDSNSNLVFQYSLFDSDESLSSFMHSIIVIVRVRPMLMSNI